MAQPKMARITCRQCKSLYDSERELGDHMQAAHRGFVSAQVTFLHGGSQPNSFEIPPGTSKEEWAKLSAQLRQRIQARFNPEELDVIDRFILLASQGSVFDHVCW